MYRGGAMSQGNYAGAGGGAAAISVPAGNLFSRSGRWLRGVKSRDKKESAAIRQFSLSKSDYELSLILK